MPASLEVRGARALHLCQCYEALWDGIGSRRDEIEAVYRLPTRKLAVSPHLVELLAARHGVVADWIPQPFEPELFRPPAQERVDDGRLRVLIVGPWDLPIKGVEWGLEALRPLRDEGWLDLVRLSLDVHPAELAFWPDADRRVNVAPAAAPEVYAGADAYVGLCERGRGIRPARARSDGVRAPLRAHRHRVRCERLDPAGAASLRVPRGDAAALRAAVRRLRDDAALRRRLGAAGRAIAERFTEAQEQAQRSSGWRDARARPGVGRRSAPWTGRRRTCGR